MRTFSDHRHAIETARRRSINNGLHMSGLSNGIVVRCQYIWLLCGLVKIVRLRNHNSARYRSDRTSRDEPRSTKQVRAKISNQETRSVNMAERRVDTTDDPDADSHRRAAAKFARRVRECGVDDIEELLLFGSTARGDASGLESDVDFLAVVSDTADESAVAEELRTVAYDVMLDVGPVVEIHVLSRSDFETRREQGNPFVWSVIREGRSYA